MPPCVLWNHLSLSARELLVSLLPVQLHHPALSAPVPNSFPPSVQHLAQHEMRTPHLPPGDSSIAASSRAHLLKELLQGCLVKDIQLLEKNLHAHNLLHALQAFGKSISPWGDRLFCNAGRDQALTGSPGATGSQASLPRMALWKLSITTGI